METQSGPRLGLRTVEREALTELAHDIPHTDARTDLEVRDGRLLDLAACYPERRPGAALF